MTRFGLLGRLIKDLRLLMSLIRDYWNGNYRDVSFYSITIFMIAIIYALSPIDIISDFIPGLGQIDDAVILFVCLYLLEKDLLKYKEWKIKND